ncbi:MAG TPA: hypothetical protein VN031_01055 [Candidatus Microsaccharimonas sp.]|nr:hypothetical protein [Candidatus Microsaccharimonas sp.]
MDKQPDVKKRVEQFYKLLADYGLTGKSQPMNQRQRQDINKLFPD